MKNLDLFKRTMDILWKAYKDGHLIHDDPCGCAVGNMVCYGLNTQKYMKRKKNNYFGSSSREWTDVLRENGSNPSTKARVDILSTGYTNDEILDIEAAFEGRTYHPSINGYGRTSRRYSDETGIRGFLDVIKKLGEIHEAPEIAKCLMKSVKDGTYSYESEIFKSHERKSDKVL